MKKEILALVFGLSLLTGTTYVEQAAAVEISFIDIDLSNTPNPDDEPIGIDCGTVEDRFVYVTIFDQGSLAKIDKVPLQNGTRVVELIEDIDSDVIPFGQDFYSVARDPFTGNLFINERDNGKAWRFNPSEPTNEDAWDRIPLIPEIVHPNVSYPLTYPVDPDRIVVDETSGGGVVRSYGFVQTSRGGVVFANGFIWIGITFRIDFDSIANSMGLNDMRFSGLIKVSPDTLQVTRINITDSGNMGSLNVDSIDSTQIWLTDQGTSKIFRFDTNTLQVVQTIQLPANSSPNHVDMDSKSIFVALHKPNPTAEPGIFSEIAQIDRSTLGINIINTTAPNILSGTFSVFVNNGLLIWTDESNHVGNIDLSTTPPTVLPFETTVTEGNHFGCVPVDGEFWFAGRGSAKVGILPNSQYIGGRPTPTSKFSGGRPVRVTADSRYYEFGDPTDPRYDSNGPVIEVVLIQEGSIKILAKITDTVGVKDAQVIIGKKAFPMSRHAGSQSWWYRVFTADELPGTEDTLSVKIIASDFNNNKAEHSFTLEVPIGALSATTEGSPFIIAPLSAVGVQTDQGYSIIGSGVIQDNQNISPQITIKNTGNEPLQNIRVVLSPELKGKFLLSDYAIKSVAPQSEYVVSLKLNGKPNVDAGNNPIPYSGKVIISVDNRTPYVLQLSGEIPNGSASLQSLFMKMVASKSDQRYKSFEKPDLRISQDADYKITLGSGESMVKGSDELIISNTSDKPLRNLRIMISSISDHFLLGQKNIDFLPAGSFVKVKLVSKLTNAETRGLSGEIIIAPENGLPVTVQVKIEKRVADDKNALYEVRTLSGDNAISSTVDAIVIKNNSAESVDNVRVILPQQLARIFSLSEDSLKSIEPNEEKTIYLQQRGTVASNVRQILNDYQGDVIIVSADGMKKVVPVSIVWKSISSEHFIINARDRAQELMKATQVINFLERSYAQTSSIVGETNSKTVIYMTSSLDEIRMLTDLLAPSTYVFDQDIGFVWSNSEDVNILALKEFVHRTVMQNYGSYWTKQKISADYGNWLIDGISSYVTASIVGERGIVKEQVESFIEEPTSFEWFGTATPSDHGASYTLFKFLASKYGDVIIDMALNNLSSNTVSNNRCATFEQCVLVTAVDDVNELSIEDKRNYVSFATILKEWEYYVQEQYGIHEDELTIYSLQ